VDWFLLIGIAKGLQGFMIATFEGCSLSIEVGIQIKVISEGSVGLQNIHSTLC